MSSEACPIHALPQFFQPAPISLLQYLVTRIDVNDWRIFVERYVSGSVCDEGVATELISVLRPDLTAFPELSVEAYEAVCSIRYHYDYGYVPEKTSPAVLEAFGLALAIASEMRGIVVADAGEERLIRLVELSNEIGLESLHRCGEFICWIRVHVQSHTWVYLSMLAQFIILTLSASRLSKASTECESKELRLRWRYEGDELRAKWKGLLSYAGDEFQVGLRAQMHGLDISHV